MPRLPIRATAAPTSGGTDEGTGSVARVGGGGNRARYLPLEQVDGELDGMGPGRLDGSEEGEQEAEDGKRHSGMPKRTTGEGQDREEGERLLRNGIGGQGEAERHTDMDPALSDNNVDTLPSYSFSSPAAASGATTPQPTHRDGVFTHITQPTSSPSPPQKPSEKPSAAAGVGAPPPDYSEIAQDSVPPYVDTTVVATATEDGEVYVQGLPVGSVASFFVSMLVSMSFQFIGFMFTYLLSTTHAGKNGSRAGFGVTLIQYGLLFRRQAVVGLHHHYHGPSSHITLPVGDEDGDGGTAGGHGATTQFLRAEWLAYLFMIVGWFLIIRSTSDYIRVKRMEKVVREEGSDVTSGSGTVVVGTYV